VLQALALHLGQLSEVQALLVAELVFTLALRRCWFGQRVSAAAWASAPLTCISLGVFVGMAEPRGGHPTPTSAA
jgi:drug/metabolite transporter (DMT)-like permease